MTIPIEFRRRLGVDDQTMYRMTLADGELRLTPVRVNDEREGSPGLRSLYEYYAPVREEIIARGIPEDELYADIDAAVAAARKARSGSE